MIGAGALRLPEIALAAALFALAVGVYGSTLAPNVVFADAGELALVAATQGVAHPPGFPLYLLLSGLWLALPIEGEVAWRLNLLSAFLGALTVPVVYLAVRGVAALDRAGAEGPRWVGPLAAALLFGFSYTFWRQVTITEVYSLSLLMAAMLIALTVLYLVRAGEGGLGAHHPAAIGLVAGLGVANHLGLGLMLFGVAAAVLIAPRPGAREQRAPILRDAAIGVAAFACGLLVYAVLPMRAAADPLFAWGDPRDAGSLWRHATGWQYQQNFRPTPDTMAKQLGVFVATARHEVGLIPLLLLPAGLGQLWRTSRALFAVLAVAFALPLLYALGYDIAEDQATYFLIPFLIAAVWMGLGCDALIRWMQRGGGRVLVHAFSALALLVALSPLALNYARADRSQEHEARDYALDVLESVETDAIVLTRFWNLYAPTLYLQHLEGRRRDVAFVDLALLQYTWYVDYLLHQSPALFSGQEARLARYRALHARWERDVSDLSEALRGEAVALFGELVDGIVREGWRRGRPVYATFESIAELEARFRADPDQPFLAVPESLPLRLLPERYPYAHPLPPVSFRNRWQRESSDEVARFVRDRYVEFWLQRGRYYGARRLWGQAARAYRHADAIPPGSPAARESLRRLPARAPDVGALPRPRLGPPRP